MSVIVVGCNHHSADLALLERLAVPADETPKALKSLVSSEHVLEAAILSTCNRVEVYAHVSRFHPGLQEVRDWLARRADVHPQDLEDVHYAYFDDRAAAHLFAVAAGLDSMVVGERQIAVQVKQAMETAREEETARRILQRLFRQAVQVSRRIRRETEISSGASSMVDVGLDAAREEFGGDLAGRSVLIVGAGKIGALTGERLVELDAGRIVTWNRTRDKARRLAERVGGEVVGDGDLRDAVADADLVVCTTGAPEPILDVDLVDRALADRLPGAYPLVLLDLAMPRNVDPAAAELDHVRLIDIARVRQVATTSLASNVVAQARAIVDEEAGRFLSWTRARQVDPIIAALRERAEEIRVSEMERLGSRLSGLDEKQQQAVQTLTRGILNTLLHDPSVRLKELADRDAAEHATHALVELFDLDDS